MKDELNDIHANCEQEVATLRAQLAEARAENARLREGGCARDQGLTQWCAEAARLAEDGAMLDWLADKERSIRIFQGGYPVNHAITIAVQSAVRAEQDPRAALRGLIRAAMRQQAAERGE